MKIQTSVNKKRNTMNSHKQGSFRKRTYIYKKMQEI